METQQRFEGASVEVVLKEVRSALGVDARIIAANKIRKGGIAGFFARESYEVIAAPAAAASLPAGIDEAMFDRASEQVMGGRSTRSLMEIADLVSGAESQASTLGTRPGTPWAPSVPPTPPGAPAAWAPPTSASPVASAPPAMPVRPSASFEPLRPDDMPRLSTETGPFNDVLQRMAADAAPEIAQAIDRHMGSAIMAPPTAPAAPVHDLKRVGPQARNEAGPQARNEAGPQARNEAGPQARNEAGPPSTPPPAPPMAAAPVAQLAAGIAPMTAPDGPDPDSHVPALASELHVVPKPAPEMDRTAHLLSCLEREHRPRATVMHALQGLPQAPALPDAAGVVIVVVGSRQAALKLCRKLARSHKTDPRDVVLASQTYRGSSIPAERRILDLTEASRDRRSWHRREQPTFVAVDTPPALHSQGLAWSRDVVARLEPHLVIGLASATRKTEDVAVWAEGAGGVDGLALFDVAETTSPQSVLALEIPVVYLDETPATPATWATLLLEGSET